MKYYSGFGYWYKLFYHTIQKTLYNLDNIKRIVQWLGSESLNNHSLPLSGYWQGQRIIISVDDKIGQSNTVEFITSLLCHYYRWEIMQ